MRFEKWQALGNDYLIFGAPSLPWELSAERVRRICDPHFGVGSDGILLLSPSADPDLVADLRIFNPDGSEAELSGNGVREAVLYLHRNGWAPGRSFSIGTPAGPVTPEVIDERTASVAMGRAATASADFPSGRPGGDRDGDGGGSRLELPARLDRQPAVRDRGPRGAGGASTSPRSGPRSSATSCSRTAPTSPSSRSEGSRVRARIFERGVGETLSSGTGASGAAVAAFLGGAASPITVELDGGELEVEISPQLDVRLSGWAEPVFSGELSQELLAALSELP